MDVLSDVMATLRSGSASVTTGRLEAPWGIGVDATRSTVVHMIRRGRCWLAIDKSRDPLPLSEGDVVLVAAGSGHRLSNPSNASVVPPDKAASLRHRADDVPSDAATILLCAKYQIDERSLNPARSVLPPLIYLSRGQVEANQSLSLALDLLTAEAAGERAGWAVVRPRLLDSVLVFLLRTWIESLPVDRQAPGLQTPAGWFGALRDRGVATALHQIHESPAHPWTVGDLADTALQSRATFGRRFTELVGIPPLTYLTRWRMNVAAKAMREGDHSIDAISASIGYASAAAFSKAFRRVMGVSPGDYRRIRRGAAEMRSAE